MSRRHKAQQSYYQRLLFVFKNAAVFLPIMMIPFGFLARFEYVDNRFYTNDTIFATIVLVYAALAGAYLYINKRWSSHQSDLIFTIASHALTTLFILYVSGFLSAFLAMWIVLMISTDLRYGDKGFFASFLGLCLAGALSLAVHPEVPVNEQLEVVQGAIVVGAIGYVIVRIRAITDRERLALSKTRKQEIYQRERLLALVNSMGDAVVATDQAGNIKVYNATMLNLLDTNLDLTGKPIDSVLHLRNSHDKSVKLIEEAQLTHTFSRTDLSHHYNNDESIRLYINVAPIQPGYQSHAERGYIFILRDITKEKTLEEERDEFISVVSHELRTPVAIAEGNLSNIKILQQRGADPAVITRAVESAHEQVLYLAKLVNDLGTLSRAERGVGADAETINLADLLKDMYKTYAPQAQAKKLDIDLELPPHLPDIRSSRLYLEEILQNLITNAIKYTPSGSVAIKAVLGPDGLVISVHDTGIGISKTDQKHMFEKFYRSEDYRTRESSGTGLGLYVCKKLAEKLGVDIKFESRLNHGSAFIVTIPPKQLVTTVQPGAVRVK